MKKILNIWTDFFGLLYPNVCASCGNKLIGNEDVICTFCLFSLPKTNFHLEKENPVSTIFWGRVNIENATAYFRFNKGSEFRKLIHKLKYSGQKEIGYVLGKKLGAELIRTPEYMNIDVIVPVPLHPKREKKRGYNQCDWIAKGLSESMGKPMDNRSFYRRLENVTQTSKSRQDRWDNVSSIFALRNREAFRGKHILLIDDVVTTGSTLEACADALLEPGTTRISIATLAVAN